VALFIILGFWQLDRAEQKRALEQAFADTGRYVTVDAETVYEPYQPLTASGRYLLKREFLLDNVILDGRLGYYLVTPFEYESGKPLLLVNRGWAPKTAGSEPAGISAAAPDEGVTTVRGRAGQLPRVGIRAGEAFAYSAGEWPRIANWPTIDELSASLGRDVLPFVLLADPEPGTTLIRRWQPQQAGPMRHIGYAFQWFALALAVVVVAVVVYRSQRMRQ